MTVIVESAEAEVVFVEIEDSAGVVAAPSADPSIVELIIATAVTVEMVPATQYLELVEHMLRGPTGPPGPPGGTILSGWWDYSVLTTPPPGLGQIRTAPDPTVAGQPMTIYLSATDDTGLVWQGVGAQVGDSIRLRGSQGAVQYVTISSVTTTVPGPSGYVTIQGTVTSLTGQIARTATVEVTLIRGSGGEMVLTYPTGSEPSLVGVPDGTLLVEYTP